MRKESYSSQIRSSYLTLQSLKEILEFIEEYYIEDNKKNKYYSKPEFSFALKDGYECTENNKNDFLKSFKFAKISLLKSLKFSYYGENTSIYINYESYAFDYLSYSIKTNNKKDFAYLKDKILMLMGTGNWNWVIHNFFFDFILSFIIIAMLLYLVFQLSKNTLDIITEPYISFFIFLPVWFFCTSVLTKIYPKIIIDLDNKKYGRNFKYDLWKIISLIVTLIIIPILVN